MAEHFARDVDRCCVRVTVFAALDEMRILCKSAGVDVKRNACLPGDAADFADVGHRHGLSAAGVIGDRHHDDRDSLRPMLLDQSLEGVRIHVSLERES